MRERHLSQKLDPPPLLETKLAIPRLRSTLVARQRLLAHLDGALERKLCLISAPAGYGKTTLVCQWIGARCAQNQRLQAAWLSLESRDNDPSRFWSYLIVACQVFDALVGKTSLATLAASSAIDTKSWHASIVQPATAAFLDAFLDEVSRLPGPAILVLEDYHLITNPFIHEAVARLIEHLPATLHLIIIARSDPALPLARLRVQDELVELHAADLAFSHVETLDFLQQSVPFPLPEEAIKQVEARTEGWGAGMRLLALALQKQRDKTQIDHLLETVSGSHRHILEYFVTEVLEAQPQSDQDFILRTSLLPRLTGSLCDAVTGRKTSEQLLDELERAGLFLLPLDDGGAWYRYHALFAEAVKHEARMRLGEGVIKDCYQRASTWYEENEMLPEAVDASLSAGDYGRAARLIERLAEKPSRNERQGLFTLQLWLERLPPAILRGFPGLCFLYANALVFLSISDQLPAETTVRVEKALGMAEEGWKAAENLPGLGEIFAFRALLAFRRGEFTAAAKLARRSLGWLPAEAAYASSRVICLSLIGQELRQQGEFEAAREKFLESLALTEASGNLPGKRVMMQALGELCFSRGELRTAAEYFQQELSQADEDITDRVKALFGLTQIWYEWNDLARAESSAQEILQITAQYPDENLRVRASLMLTRVLQAQEKLDEAENILVGLLAKLDAASRPALRREVIACQAALQLAAGDTAAASRWVSYLTLRHEEPSIMAQAREGLVTAQAWMMLGESQKSLQTLDHWMESARKMDLPGLTLEILLAKSLVYAATGQMHRAKECIRQALPGAHREGYQRLFLDRGQPALRVLRSVIGEISEMPLLAYLRSLMLAFAQTTDPFGEDSQGLGLVEPLSTQELRVLHLLEAGLTRQEIAQELVLSTNTVKTHLLHIYHKLNVSSRAEAIKAAQALFKR